MVSITLSVPTEIKEMMEKFPEMNWSGFVRKSVEEKVKQLAWREQMLEQLEKEKAVTQWSVKLQRSSRRGRYEDLRKKGLI